MANKDTKVMPRLSTRELCLGAGCLVYTNGTWKRAVVINCTRSVGFDVKFIDTETYDEILNDALALPGELAVMQNQALECSLRDVPASSNVDKQLKELEGKQVLVYVEEVNNSRLIVKLYDLSGNGIMNTEEKIPPVCPMPILSSTHKVSVSYADHSTNIWLQRYSDVDIETKLSEDLQQYYTNSGQRLELEVHLLCATKYSDDGQWYRGRIVSLTETMAYVNYIDYGNTEEVALDSIMILEPQFYEPHQLAINVSLSVSFIGTEAEQKDILQDHLMNKDFSAVFYNVHKKWIVDLIKNEKKLSDRFRSLNLVKIEQTVCEPTSEIHVETTTPGRFDVCVSHVDSPSHFWLQRMDKIASLNEKQEQLQAEVIDFVAIDGIPEEGILCIASYSIDDLWYRAEVLDADEDITTVRFIDYGNTDVIDNKASSIRQMPEAWKNLETFALKCRLDVIPVDTEDWSESTCERFRNLVTSTESLQALVVADTMPKRVELFINDKSVSETLVEEKHAIIISTEQEPVDEIVDLELDPHSAFVCHINSPSEFWVQEEKSVADLEVMADRFMVADMFPKIDDIKEGLLCVAKYPEDEQWYRARVISHDENGTQVIYIDYGNSAVSTEIRAISEDVANIPPLSRKCCLELPSQVEEWSEQAREEFVKLAAEGATIFLLDVLKDQETSLVKLTLDGQNVADILGSMCERTTPAIEERLPPLGEENSPNVMVSHVISPSEFWIQAENSISELEVMSDRLGDADSFLTLKTLDEGTICAARYLEDGYWYKAKIIALCEEGTGAEVLYIDYGNSRQNAKIAVPPWVDEQVGRAKKQQRDGEELNPFFLPEFINILSLSVKEFPLWTSVGLDCSTHATSSYVESYFNDIKTRILKTGPMRVDKFLIKHANDIHGATLLFSSNMINYNAKRCVHTDLMTKEENEINKPQPKRSYKLHSTPKDTEQNRSESTSESERRFNDLLEQSTELKTEENKENMCFDESISKMTKNKRKILHDIFAKLIESNGEKKTHFDQSANNKLDNLIKSPEQPVILKKYEHTEGKSYPVEMSPNIKDQSCDSDLLSNKNWQENIEINEPDCLNLDFNIDDVSHFIDMPSNDVESYLDSDLLAIENWRGKVNINNNNFDYDDFNEGSVNDHIVSDIASSLTGSRELEIINIKSSNEALLDHSYSSMNSSITDLVSPIIDQQNNNFIESKSNLKEDSESNYIPSTHLVSRLKEQPHRKSKKSSKYFKAYPEVSQINAFIGQRKKSALLPHGSLLPPIKIKENNGEINSYFVTNTCSFDSLIHVLMTGAIDDINYQAFLKASSNPTLQLVFNLVQKGVTQYVLRQRVLILKNYYNCTPQVQTDLRIVSYMINAFDSIASMTKNTLTTEPSIQNTKKCTGCNVTTFPTVILEPNHKIIGKEGFSSLEKALGFRSPIYKIRCCNPCLGKYTWFREPRIHIFIELDIRPNIQCKTGLNCRLEQLPTTLKFQSDEDKSFEYRFVGVIAYVSGHYIAYCLRSNGIWEIYDDLRKNISTCSSKTIINPHLAVYLQKH